MRVASREELLAWLAHELVDKEGFNMLACREVQKVFLPDFLHKTVAQERVWEES